MPTHLEAAVLSAERDNDYFTSTIVGLPAEVTLGKAFTKRKLSRHPTIMIDAMTAAVWHTEAAHALVKQQIKQSPKTLGLPYPAGSFAYRRSKNASFFAFLLGFCLCAALCYAYISLPWLQQIIRSSFSGF